MELYLELDLHLYQAGLYYEIVFGIRLAFVISRNCIMRKLY